MISFKFRLCILFTLLVPFITQAQQRSSEIPEPGITNSIINLEMVDKTLTDHSDRNNEIWVNAGIGKGSMGIAVTAGLYYNVLGTHLFTFRGTAESELFFGDSLWDVGLMYGRATTHDVFHASISAGIGIIGGNRFVSGGFFSENIYKDINWQLGIPIESQLLLHGTAVGIGLTLFANINLEESFTGVALSLQLGKMR